MSDVWFDLTDVTLADEETNSILSDNAKRAIQGNEAMQVMQTGDQCKWRHLVAKFASNASGAIWWSNLQMMQVVASGKQICNYCKWRYLVAKFATNASSAI